MIYALLTEEILTHEARPPADFIIKLFLYYSTHSLIALSSANYGNVIILISTGKGVI